MSILLIAPPFSYGRLDSASPRCPPLGLASIAAYLEKFGYEVRILDAFALGLTREQIESAIKAIGPEIVGITGVTSSFPRMMDIAKIAKTVNKDTKVLMGGPHASVMPESCLSNDCVDCVVLGEGEITTKELIDKIIRGKSIAHVPGIAFKNGNSIKFTPKRELVKNIDDLPAPAYHLLPMDAYRPYASSDVGRKFCSMITSRGCPNFCIFCTSSALWGHRYRARSPERVLKEMKLLYENYGVRHIYFQDDEFTISHHRVEKICEMLIDSKMDVVWECLARVDQMTKSLLEKMKRAGCIGIRYGIESGSPRVLEKIKKRITLEQARNAIKWTRCLGMWTEATFMIGFPFETKDDVMATINFAKSLPLDVAYFNILTPFPNTEVYGEIQKKKLFVGEGTWDRWISHGTDPVIKTEHLTSKEIANLTGKAYLEFYLRPAFMLNKLRSIRNVRNLKKIARAGVDVIKTGFNWTKNEGNR